MTGEVEDAIVSGHLRIEAATFDFLLGVLSGSAHIDLPENREAGDAAENNPGKLGVEAIEEFDLARYVRRVAHLLAVVACCIFQFGIPIDVAVLGNRIIARVNVCLERHRSLLVKIIHFTFNIIIYLMNQIILLIS